MIFIIAPTNGKGPNGPNCPSDCSLLCGTLCATLCKPVIYPIIGIMLPIE